jgi:hypothetical protein
MVSWSDSSLWMRIVSLTKEQDPCRLLLNTYLPRIVLIEDKGSTTPKDFTLHDSGHGQRVAEWMTRIIAPEVLSEMSPIELALLLLSAHLHDIGMSPEWGKVEAHYRYLLEGRTTHLSAKERAQFQVWLAENEDIDFEPPLRNAGQIERIMTYYCRSRHNDWSAEWMARNLPENGLYNGWREDLIAICKSHHYGYDELARPLYDVKRIQGQYVHRRFLAAVLRMADILENDPERTPDVLLHHRAIANSSEIYWIKDQVMHQELVDGRLLISAEPISAIIHRAIEDTADAIDHELRLCERLSREFSYGYDPGSGDRLPYRWTLPSSSTRNIRPRHGTYEYIAGSFRPNTKRLLELLAGNNLYDNKLVAVRELLQNAFDGVNEQIARQQVLQNQTDDAGAERIAALHCVELTFELGQKSAKIICQDTGAGMSKAIISGRLLVSGSRPDAALVALQLACKEKHIEFIRSGQFGIGVLSYFMLADHLLFRTRRSLESGIDEGTGWEFESWGILRVLALLHSFCYFILESQPRAAGAWFSAPRRPVM